MPKEYFTDSGKATTEPGRTQMNAQGDKRYYRSSQGYKQRAPVLTQSPYSAYDLAFWKTNHANALS